MFADPFEQEPRPHKLDGHIYDGIDLLSGMDDISDGKVAQFFASMIEEKGLSSFVAYSRLAQRVLFPHYILGYAEELAVRTHGLCADRTAPAWELVRTEIAYCSDYLTMWSETPSLPIPVLISSEEEGHCAWDMRYSGKYQYYAGLLIPKIEALQDFTDDETAIDDLDALLAYYHNNKHDANPIIV